jgi:enoyl-CoA hydratase/carnithine racemase
MTDHLRFDARPGLLDIVLTRPNEGNIISKEMAEAMIAALDALGPDVKLVRLLGEGPDFCRGRQSPQFDRATASAMDFRAIVAQGPLDLYAAFKRAKAPIFGVVQGQAFGVGAALAGLCDVTLAASDAVFRVPEMDHGVVPTLVMWALAGRLSDKAISTLVLTRDAIGAAKAEALGLVDIVVEPQGLAAEVERLTEKMLVPSASTMQATKEYMRFAGHIDPAAALSLSANLSATVLSTKNWP